MITIIVILGIAILIGLAGILYYIYVISKVKDEMNDDIRIF